MKCRAYHVTPSFEWEKKNDRYTMRYDLENGKEIAKCKFPNKKFDLKFPEKENIVQIFTDGSKMKKGSITHVGFATWSKMDEFNFTCTINDIASIYTAECKALSYLIDNITNKNYSEFVIFSDSKKNEKILINLSKNKGTFYFEHFYVNKNKPWFYNTGLSRKSTVSINRIRCDHNSLNSNLYRHKIVDSDLCKCGEDADTVEHIFWCCKLSKSERETLLKEIRKEYKIGPYSVINLLALSNVRILNTISEFIDKIDCKIKNFNHAKPRSNSEKVPCDTVFLAL
ncbi:hypothetical protein TSAR_016262 [Trichomalopsis sarcophagae]|uniref:RNase H type-1 domain-containing protein n=1 Tax=Trichomalopsis sarcophagae TaxID=543379 RepID=A0A232EZ91_9HYME|nr:hypothetical protein TSAR_016262 [Trichomalopsis sarcophagae]